MKSIFRFALLVVAILAIGISWIISRLPMSFFDEGHRFRTAHVLSSLGVFESRNICLLETISGLNLSKGTEVKGLSLGHSVILECQKEAVDSAVCLISYP